MWWTWDPKKSWYELYLSQTTEKAMKELVALLHPMGVHHQAYVKNGVLHFHAYLSREEMETVTDTFPRRFWKNIDDDPYYLRDLELSYSIDSAIR